MGQDIKGNDGTARRRHLVVKILCVVGVCSGTILFKVMGWGFNNRVVTKHHLTEEFVDKSRSVKDFQGSSKSEIQKIELILSAKVHLIGLSIQRSFYKDDQRSYKGVIGTFCRIDWSKHKQNPSSVPMFRDLIKHSEGCRGKNTFEMDIKKVTKLARTRDEDSSRNQSLNPHTRKPKGFVFHESRCGSTLVANSLIAMDPARHRVYSESPPPITALKACGVDGKLCPIEKAANLFKDVIYIMSRTDEPMEKNVFFKIQSVGSKFLDVFLHAFPHTPWIFVYRDPIQVMMSQLSKGTKNANCIGQLRLKDIPETVHSHLVSLGKDVSYLNAEEKCALHLRTLCESAVKMMETSVNGTPVNYINLIPNLINRIIPDHFGIPMTDNMRQQITEITSTYSKARDKGTEWKEDSQRKSEGATKEIREASALLLDNVFQDLELLSSAF